MDNSSIVSTLRRHGPAIGLVSLVTIAAWLATGAFEEATRDPVTGQGDLGFTWQLAGRGALLAMVAVVAVLRGVSFATVVGVVPAASVMFIVVGTFISNDAQAPLGLIFGLIMVLVVTPFVAAAGLTSIVVHRSRHRGTRH